MILRVDQILFLEAPECLNRFVSFGDERLLFRLRASAFLRPFGFLGCELADAMFELRDLAFAGLLFLHQCGDHFMEV